MYSLYKSLYLLVYGAFWAFDVVEARISRFKRPSDAFFGLSGGVAIRQGLGEGLQVKVALDPPLSGPSAVAKLHQH